MGSPNAYTVQSPDLGGLTPNQFSAARTPMPHYKVDQHQISFRPENDLPGQQAPPPQPAKPPSPDLSGLGPFASLFNSTFYSKPMVQSGWGGQQDNLFNPFLQQNDNRTGTVYGNSWANPWLGQ